MAHQACRRRCCGTTLSLCGNRSGPSIFRRRAFWTGMDGTVISWTRRERRIVAEAEHPRRVESLDPVGPRAACVAIRWPAALVAGQFPWHRELRLCRCRRLVLHTLLSGKFWGLGESNSRDETQVRSATAGGASDGTVIKPCGVVSSRRTFARRSRLRLGMMRLLAKEGVVAVRNNPAAGQSLGMVGAHGRPAHHASKRAQGNGMVPDYRYASSTEFVGEVWFRKIAKCVI